MTIIFQYYRQLIVLITLLFSTTVFPAMSQEKGQMQLKNSFQLMFGLNELKEGNLHDKVHNGILNGLIYEHSKQSNNISLYNIGLKFSRVKTAYEDLSASAYAELFGRYGYFFKVTSKTKSTFHFGPEIRLNYDVSFYPNWDESHLYWANYLSLGIGNQYQYQITDKQSLKINICIPLFSAFSRPIPDRQYKIDNTSFGGIINSLNSNLESGTVNKSFYLNTNVEYVFRITDRISEAICYSYNYTRLSSREGLPFQSNQHGIGLKLYF
ncbi:MAG TPA: hypothetical protein VK152_11260 [Paludibacter sp.]|nr:hypothetical protein [Paludibacter sp.]